MQRMHSLGMKAALIFFISSGFGTTASAALLRPNDVREYPDINTFTSGYQTYSYDPSTGTGLFQLSTTPYLLTSGKNADGSLTTWNVTPTSTYQQSQKLTAVLDANGNLVASPLNSFQVYGSVVIGDKSYTGLLLSGTPTAFGSQSLKPIGVSDADLFDLSLKITGGSLSSLYGPDAYIRVTASANSTFKGAFTGDFSSEVVLTSTHPIASIVPSPVPEPTTLVVLLACGAGLFYRGRRRIALTDLTV